MSEKEIWKDIPDYEGLYEASTFGRIRISTGRITYTKKHGYRHWKQKILKPKQHNDYRTGHMVSLYKDHKYKDFLVARLVAITFLGKSDLTVNHIDGNRLNNHIENLEWVSRKENIQKAFETGLYSQNQTKIINKKTNETFVFRSSSLASQYIGKKSGYISTSMGRGKTENEEWKWEILHKGKMNNIRDIQLQKEKGNAKNG